MLHHFRTCARRSLPTARARAPTGPLRCATPRHLSTGSSSSSSSSSSSAIQVEDVTPRDGLQNEATVLATDSKLELVERIVATRPASVEITSFVRADLIPALADASDLCARLADAEWLHKARGDGMRFAGLVPNMRGYEGLRQHDGVLDTVCVLTSATESHSKANVNRSVADALEASCEVISLAKSEGFVTKAYVSMCFGCPFEGDVDPAVIQDIVQAYAAVDADMVVICDTLGIGYAEQADGLISSALEAGVPVEKLALHIHDTHGRGASICQRGFELGIRRFDSAVGGAGGCNFAPGAQGNIATERMLTALEQVGAEHSVDRGELDTTRGFLEAQLGKSLRSE
jgi:hydroxymethylglutaryl-CoA lyase